MARRTVEQEVGFEHVAEAAVVAEHGVVQVHHEVAGLHVERHNLAAAQPVWHRVVVARADARAFRVDADQVVARELQEVLHVRRHRARGL